MPSKYKKVNHPKRACSICGLDFKPLRTDSIICYSGCRKRNNQIRASQYYYANHNKCVEVRREASRIFCTKSPEKKLLDGAKGRAKLYGLAFDLVVEDIKIPEMCPILKVSLKRGTRYAPSLDRLDNSLGYIKSNIWVISRLANTMKNNATLEELRKFGQWASLLTHS